MELTFQVFDLRPLNYVEWSTTVEPKIKWMLVPQNLLKFSSISEKNIWEILQKKEWSIIELEWL